MGVALGGAARIPLKKMLNLLPTHPGYQSPPDSLHFLAYKASFATGILGQGGLDPMRMSQIHGTSLFDFLVGAQPPPCSRENGHSLLICSSLSTS